jgi:hypothetical protein
MSRLREVISSQEEDHMQSTYRYFVGSLILTAALAAPAAINAAANAPQEVQVRVYDHNHHDYHNWDDREDRSYRLYLSQRHREYHPYAEIREKDQRSYWNWRHEHPDHDGR